jgi:hypothetical protein
VCESVGVCVCILVYACVCVCVSVRLYVGFLMIMMVMMIKMINQKKVKRESLTEDVDWHARPLFHDCITHLCGVSVVLESYYNGIAVVLQRCYQWCY